MNIICQGVRKIVGKNVVYKTRGLFCTWGTTRDPFYKSIRKAALYQMQACLSRHCFWIYTTILSTRHLIKTIFLAGCAWAACSVNSLSLYCRLCQRRIPTAIFLKSKDMEQHTNFSLLFGSSAHCDVYTLLMTSIGDCCGGCNPNNSPLKGSTIINSVLSPKQKLQSHLPWGFPE